MKVIICVDERMGTEYNRRPQARDRGMAHDLLLLVGGSPLRAVPSLLPLFPEDARDRILVSGDPLADAGPGEYVLTTAISLERYEEEIEELVLYRWNRLYPSDRKLDLDPARWRLVQYVSFAGTSHANIVRETYRRNGEASPC